MSSMYNSGAKFHGPYEVLALNNIMINTFGVDEERSGLAM